MTNKDRADNAHKALVAYCAIAGTMRSADDDAIINLLTDIRHYCAQADHELCVLQELAFMLFLSQSYEEEMKGQRP
ncbi:MAG: hypothetical protein AAF668_06660 [Pseudomonadota bacterium]